MKKKHYFCKSILSKTAIMKKSLILLVAAMLLVSTGLRAQTPIALPNGSFEQWTTNPGYSASVLFLSLPIYDAFSTPTGWNYPSYPINQTISMMGMNININTSVPLILANAETTSVPAGTKALRLQTLKVEDIVDPTALSLAAGSIDTTLLQTVIPSVLSTGELDLMAFLPIIDTFLAGMANPATLLPSLLQVDANDYVSGGIALNGFRPGHLSGSYKYQSATSGDNGGIVVLGTHYNPATHRRDIVGGGFSLALTDTGAYTPFTVAYEPLSALLPNAPTAAADSLVVLILSSANNSMQQGSKLYIDNLVLWSAPDTCSHIYNLTAQTGIHEATLAWSADGTVAGYELEYGLAGFAAGSGTTQTTSSPSTTLAGLEADSDYEVRIRSHCSDSIYGEWNTLVFTTDPDTCATVIDLSIWNYVSDDFPQYMIGWSGSSQPAHWEVEYGLLGFEHGEGTLMTTTSTSFELSELDLEPGSWYDFYVRSVCADSVYGEWDSVQHQTHCAPVENIFVGDEELAITNNNMIGGYSVSWAPEGNSQWDVCYGIYSDYPPDMWGTIVTVDTPYLALPVLQPDTRYTITVTPYCGDQNYGPTTTTSFQTMALDGIGERGAISLTVSPNPARGQCLVTLGDEHPAEMRLYSIDGRLLQTLATDGSPLLLQLPARGIYLLQVSTSAGSTTLTIVNE